MGIMGYRTGDILLMDVHLTTGFGLDGFYREMNDHYVSLSYIGTIGIKARGISNVALR